jgi:hypothetical protein
MIFKIIPQVFAEEITNNALPSAITGQGAGPGLALYIASLWRTVVILGGLAFIVYLVWGGVEYLTSAGDKGRIDDASKKISSAVIGLAILVGSYAIVYFVQNVFQISILKPVFPNNLTP